jgi:hypothetical protein
MTLTEPQVWVLIGIFATAMFGMIGIVTSSFNRNLAAAIGGVQSEIGSVRTEIGGVRSEMQSETGGLRAQMQSEIGGLRAQMQSEIGGLRETVFARFEAMDARFEAFDAKFSGKFEVLDRDIQALSRHVFGADPH